MWLAFALAASLLWGVTYVLNEKMFNHISVATTLALGAACAFVVMTSVSLAQGTLVTDLQTIVSSKRIFWLVAAGTLSFVAADWFIAASVEAKNATLAAIIEISYPIFIILFAYILFREVQFNIPILVGGILVFIGVVVVYWGSK